MTQGHVRNSFVRRLMNESSAQYKIPYYYYYYYCFMVYWVSLIFYLINCLQRNRKIDEKEKAAGRKIGKVRLKQL